jgi:hypothetical protein
MKGREKSRRFLVLAMLGLVALVFAGCDWPMSAFDAALTGSSLDTALNTANVSTLQTLFTNPGQFGPPVESNGVVYATLTAPDDASGSLEAFDANGATSCSGSPNQCSPLWTAAVSGSSLDGSAPAVVNGVVYVTTFTATTGVGELYAFDANGVTNCSGSPKVCQPLWTAPAGVSYASPTVANGVVYLSSTANSDLEAFDANGVTNCSGTPKVCNPLWSATAGGSTPAVANGIVYVSSSPTSTTLGRLYAFSASGTTNCSGTPTICNPLWSAPMGTAGIVVPPSPAVSGGVVYAEDAEGTLFAFDAGGVTNCSGTPTICSPLWTATLAGTDELGASPAVANGTVYAPGGTLEAFDANGVTNCSGTPKTCTPLRSYNVDVAASSPSVANGLVFIGSGGGSSNGPSDFLAFDADGKTNCSGTPLVCNPLWTGETTGIPYGSAAVANGKIYLADDSFTVFATNLYAWVLPPPNTFVGIPSNNATVSGTSQLLGAGASSGVTEVQYEITGGTLNDSVIATATPTIYGWLAKWNTTTVANGTYTLQSVASYGGEVTGTSPGITITVSN